MSNKNEISCKIILVDINDYLKAQIMTTYTQESNSLLNLLSLKIFFEKEKKTNGLDI